MTHYSYDDIMAIFFELYNRSPRKIKFKINSVDFTVCFTENGFYINEGMIELMNELGKTDIPNLLEYIGFQIL